jgi:hypothetical protein
LHAGWWGEGGSRSLCGWSEKDSERGMKNYVGSMQFHPLHLFFWKNSYCINGGISVLHLLRRQFKMYYKSLLLTFFIFVFPVILFLSCSIFIELYPILKKMCTYQIYFFFLIYIHLYLTFVVLVLTRDTNKTECKEGCAV